MKTLSSRPAKSSPRAPSLISSAATSAILLTTLLGTSQATLAGSGTRLKCQASNSNGQIGAKFEQRDGRNRISVELTQLRSNVGVTTSVSRGALEILATTAVPPEGAGTADLNLDSQDGDIVPVLQAADQVTASQGGAIILSCTLADD